MTADFDLDTAVEPTGRPDCYAATVTDRWSVGPAPNGGYLLAIAVRALLASSAHPDPLTVTAHYYRPPVPGPVTVEVERVCAGRSVGHLAARLRQDGDEVVRVLAATGCLSGLAGPTHVVGAPPELPPPAVCVRATSGPLPGGLSVPLMERLDVRFPPGEPGWAHGEPGGRAEVAAWLGFRDGREPDTFACLLAVDALPPAVFELGVRGWVPTLELTVHLRALPAPGLLRVAVRSCFLIDGTVEEDAEVWDSTGALVAQSRQLARVRSA